MALPRDWEDSEKGQAGPGGEGGEAHRVHHQPPPRHWDFGYETKIQYYPFTFHGW